MLLDIKTLVFIFGLTNAIQATAIFILSIKNKTYKGLSVWATGSAIIATGVFFILLRTIKPIESIAIFFQNVLVLLGLIFQYVGSLNFLDKKENKYFLGIFFIIFSSLYYYFIFTDNSISARNTISSIIFAIIAFLIAFNFFSARNQTIAKSSYFLSFILLFTGSFFLFRIIFGFTLDDDFFNPVIMQIFTFLVVIAEGSLLTFGLIIMLNQRLNAVMTEANNKLEITNKELQKLNAQKDTFFTIISHDLRGPVGNISYMLHEMKYMDEISENDKKELIAELHKQADKTYMLLENLLEWSKLQLNAIDIKFERIEVKDLVENSIDLLTEIAKQKGIEIKFEIENTELEVDVKMISTVIRNVVSNAIKFVKTGGEIVIKTKTSIDKTKLIINDNGIGIKKDDLDKIFKIEEKVSKRGTNGEIGSGIGLKLCKEFVEKNNGKIEIRSELEKCTEVTITFFKINNQFNICK